VLQANDSTKDSILVDLLTVSQAVPGDGGVW